MFLGALPIGNSYAVLPRVSPVRRLPYRRAMRIGVAGIAGRMGTQVARHVSQAGATLIGGTVGGDADEVPGGITVFPTIAALAGACEAIVDFSHADAAEAHALACAAAGTALVLGTTGLTADTQLCVAAASQQIPVVQAANFSPGVVLVEALVRQMAAALPAQTHDAEILDMHHRQKRDAPSGTALALGRAVAAGRGADFTQSAELSREGQTGPRRPGTIGFATLRGGQAVGEHSVIFAANDEQIVLTHRALDRGIFAAGAVRAALWTQGRAPGLYSMMDVLGINDR